MTHQENNLAVSDTAVGRPTALDNLFRSLEEVMHLVGEARELNLIECSDDDFEATKSLWRDVQIAYYDLNSDSTDNR